MRERGKKGRNGDGKDPVTNSENLSREVEDLRRELRDVEEKAQQIHEAIAELLKRQNEILIAPLARKTRWVIAREY